MDDSPPDEERILEQFRAAELRRPTGTPRFEDTTDPRGTSADEHAPLAGMPASAMDLDTIPPEIKRLFVAETRDDLRDLRQALVQLDPHQHELVVPHDIARIAHKIKGAAATLDYAVMASLAHVFEEMLLTFPRRRESLIEGDIALLNRCLNLLDRCLEAAAAEISPEPALYEQASALLDELRQGVSARPRTSPPLSEETAPLPVAALETIRRSAREEESHLRVDVRQLDELMAQVNSLATNRAQLARVRDEIARFQGEMDHAIARLKAASAQVSESRPPEGTLADRPVRPRHVAPGAAASRAWQPPAGATTGASAGTSASRSTSYPEVEGYSELDEALGALSETVADVTSNSVGLRGVLRRFSQVAEAQGALMGHMQQAVMAIRLVPLHSLVPWLQLAARQLARDQRKAVSFTVRGEMTQIDRDISEALAEPLAQLVRNAIVHGIEAPEERREAGKPEQGSVWLHADYVGSEVLIEIADDGSGINPNLLVAAAIAARMVEPDAAGTISEDEALNLMFVPGISTIEEAHVAGGRGIGLDEVRTVIERLKGSIQVMSELGRGTIFRIRVPISLSVLKVLHIGAAGGAYAVPFSSVRSTLSLAAPELIVSAQTPHTTGGPGQPRLIRRVRVDAARLRRGADPASPPETYEELPAFSLAELLGYQFRAHDPQPALVIEVGQRRVALLVDGASDEHEIVVRALAKHLRRHGVRGATVTLDGQVLLLLDLPELVAGLLEGKRALPPPRPAPLFARARAPRVLVVDDSISMRGALELTLTRAGYEVQLARDGFEALGLLLESLPQVVILDIEMPRLNGFELLRVLRTSPQFAGVRVALLTTRASERHRDHARILGADEYLLKPCPDTILLSTIERLLSRAPGTH